MASLWQSLYTREEWVVLYRLKGQDEWHLWATPDKSEALARQRMADVAPLWPNQEYRVGVKRSSLEVLDG